MGEEVSFGVRLVLSKHMPSVVCTELDVYLDEDTYIRMVHSPDVRKEVEHKLAPMALAESAGCAETRSQNLSLPSAAFSTFVGTVTPASARTLRLTRVTLRLRELEWNIAINACPIGGVLECK